MVLFYKLVGAYERKIREDKFGGCKKSFSWLRQKVYKKIDADGRDAEDTGADLPTGCRRVPARHRIQFEATEYSYSIRYSIRIRNVEDIRFDIRFE